MAITMISRPDLAVTAAAALRKGAARQLRHGAGTIPEPPCKVTGVTE